MRSPTSLLLAALLGALGGGALVWLILTPPAPPNVTVNVEPAPVVLETPGYAAPPQQPARVRVSTSNAPPLTYAPAVVRQSPILAPAEPPPPDGVEPEAPLADAGAPNLNIQANLNLIVQGGGSAAANAPTKEVANDPALANALAFAREAAEPYFKEGFAIRDYCWGGFLKPMTAKAIPYQLYKGYEYWFWMGTSVDGVKISVHLYDSEGKLADAESWQHSHTAAARIEPRGTGTFYIIVEQVSPARSLQEASRDWGLLYGFR